MTRDRSASDTTLASPIAGVVLNRSRDARDPASPGTGAAMAILAALTLLAAAPDAALALLHAGGAQATLAAALFGPVACLAVSRRPARFAHAFRSARNG